MVVIREKSDERSEELRKLANKRFRNLEYFSAIEIYNKALCFAVSNENLANVYANRSAVYLEVKQYEECLKNIEWARKHDYPADKIQKLNEREEKCRELMDEEYMGNKEKLNDFFKLSYPANPKLPFIVDCLEQKVIDENSKGIFATHDLKAGDIISIEDPFAFEFMVNYLGCCVCMKFNKLNLIPAKDNATYMFCSEECMAKLDKFEYSALARPPFIFPMIESKSIESLDEANELFEANKLTSETLAKIHKTIQNYSSAYQSTETIFDFDLSDPAAEGYKENLLECWLALKYKYYPDGDSGRELIFEHIGAFLEIDDIGAEGHGIAPLGLNCYLFLNLINHSCYGNVRRVYVNNQSVLYVTRPIKAGEEIFYNFEQIPIVYRPHVLLLNQPIGERREWLLSSRNIDCKCYYCEHDITDEKLVRGTHPEIQELIDNRDTSVKPHLLKNIDEMIDDLKELFSLINSTESDPISYDLANLKKHSDQLIRAIADLIAFPCMNLNRCGLPDNFAKVLTLLNYDFRDNIMGQSYFFTCKACNDRCKCRGGDGLPEDGEEHEHGAHQGAHVHEHEGREE